MAKPKAKLKAKGYRDISQNQEYNREESLRRRGIKRLTARLPHIIEMTIRDLIEDLEDIAFEEGDDVEIITYSGTPREEAVELTNGKVMLVTSKQYMKILGA